MRKQSFLDYVTLYTDNANPYPLAASAVRGSSVYGTAGQEGSLGPQRHLLVGYDEH